MDPKDSIGKIGTGLESPKRSFKKKNPCLTGCWAAFSNPAGLMRGSAKPTRLIPSWPRQLGRLDINPAGRTKSKAESNFFGLAQTNSAESVSNRPVLKTEPEVLCVTLLRIYAASLAFCVTLAAST